MTIHFLVRPGRKVCVYTAQLRSDGRHPDPLRQAAADLQPHEGDKEDQHGAGQGGDGGAVLPAVADEGHEAEGGGPMHRNQNINWPALAGPRYTGLCPSVGVVSFVQISS